MMQQMRWHNMSIRTINTMTQLLDICIQNMANDIANEVTQYKYNNNKYYALAFRYIYIYIYIDQ